MSAENTISQGLKTGSVPFLTLLFLLCFAGIWADYILSEKARELMEHRSEVEHQALASQITEIRKVLSKLGTRQDPLFQPVQDNHDDIDLVARKLDRINERVIHLEVKK